MSQYLRALIIFVLVLASACSESRPFDGTLTGREQVELSKVCGFRGPDLETVVRDFGPPTAIGDVITQLDDSERRVAVLLKENGPLPRVHVIRHQQVNYGKCRLCFRGDYVPGPDQYVQRLISFTCLPGETLSGCADD